MTFFKSPSSIFLSTTICVKSSQSKLYEKEWSIFSQQSFIIDYIYVDWKKVINIEKRHNGKSFEKVLDEFNSILNEPEIKNQS